MHGQQPAALWVLTALTLGIGTTQGRAADPVLDLPAIVVTATRTPEPAARTVADTTVLDRAAIERRQALTAPDLLRGVRGLSVASSGGAGKQASVFLRGTSPNHVLVLLDGVRVGSATTGAFAWELLPVAEIDRVEVVRGPRSSLYGSEAVGGVVQFFTRRGTAGTRASAEIGGGSRGTGLVAAGISGGDGDAGASLHVSHLTTDGSNAREPATVFGLRLDEPDADGYRNTGVSGRIAGRIAPRAAASLTLLQARGTTEYDGFSFQTNETDFDQGAATARLDLDPTDLWRASLTAGRSTDRRREYRDGSDVVPSRFDTESRTLSWQNDLTWGPALATIGVDHLHQQVTGSVSYARDSRSTTGAFAQVQAGVGRHRLVAGARLDDNSQFGSVTTANLAWGLALAGGWDAVAAWGSGFRAPTFNELYYPDYGNPTLQPEESDSLELSVIRRMGSWEGRLSAFRTRIDDLIVFPPPTYVGENVDRARIDGMEAELAGAVAGWDVRVALAWLDPRNETTGARLPRRPRQSAVIELDRAVGPVRAGLTWLAEGDRFDDPENRVPLGGFGVLDLRAEYALGGGWAARARVANLLDQDYQTVAGYPESGVGVFVSLVYASR